MKRWQFFKKGGKEIYMCLCMHKHIGKNGGITSKLSLDSEDKEQAFWRQAQTKVLVRIFYGLYGKDDADLDAHSNALIQ